MSDRISREELVKIYNIEITFFDSLEESGLLNIVTDQQIKYLMYEELALFERFANLHYDLEVNIPGLEVINNLLAKIDHLKNENRKLAYLSSKFSSLDQPLKP